MRVQRLLDLARIDVVSRDDDQLLLAVDDVEVAVLVHARDVSGVEPSIAERERGLLGSLVVTVHQVRTAHHELAGLADGQIARSGLEVHDLRVDVGNGDANRAELAQAPSRRRMGDRGRLRKSVAFEYPTTAGQLLELRLHLHRERRGPRLEDLNRAKIVASEVGRGRDVDPRGAGERTGPVFLDREQYVLEIEARDEHHRAAG